MKVRIEQGPLADTLAWVGQAISKNPTSPELAGIRLTATDGVLTVKAYDYDSAHTATLTADVASEGECLVSGRFLRAIVAGMTGKDVELTLDAGALAITSGRASYRTRAIPIDNYPTIPTSPATVGEVDADDLVAAIAAVRHPIDDASPFEQVRGLRMIGGNELEFVGMASPQIAHAIAPWRWKKDLLVTVHSAHFEAAAKGLRGSVTIGREDGVIGLADAERSVTVRTYAEGFTPLWEKYLERADDVPTAVLESSDLREALKRVRELNVADESAITVTIGDGELTLAGFSDGVGEGADVLEAETEGEASRGFAPRLLGDALAAVPGGPVKISAGTAHQPKLWLVEPTDHPHLTFAVMTKALPGGTR